MAVGHFGANGRVRPDLVGPLVRARAQPLDLLGAGLAVLTCVVWGSNGVGAKFSVGAVPPWTLAFLRTALAFLILATIALARQPALPRERAAWRDAALIGLLQTAGPVGLLFWAIPRVDAGLAMVLMSTQPLFVALLLQRWPGGERLTRSRWLALLAGFAGVGLVAFAKTEASLRFEWAGVAALLLGAGCWAAGTVLMRRVGQTWSDAPSLVAAQMAFGALALALPASRESVSLAAFTLPVTLSLLYLALCTTAFTFFLWYWLVRRHGASQVSVFVFTMPLAGVALGALIFGEPVPPLLLPGLALVVGSLLLVNAPPRRRRLFAYKGRYPSSTPRR